MIWEYWLIVVLGSFMIWGMVKHEKTLRKVEEKLLSGGGRDD